MTTILLLSDGYAEFAITHDLETDQREVACILLPDAPDPFDDDLTGAEPPPDAP